MAKPANITIQIPKKTSILSKPQCLTRSAFERNLKASASSKKPRTTFVVFSQPPDLGNALSTTKFNDGDILINGKVEHLKRPPCFDASEYFIFSTIKNMEKSDVINHWRAKRNGHR